MRVPCSPTCYLLVNLKAIISARQQTLLALPLPLLLQPQDV